MRFAAFSLNKVRAVGSLTLTAVVAIGLVGCAGHSFGLRNAAKPQTPIAGVWDAVFRETIQEGIGAGDTLIEKQEWHLNQAGGAISGYYLAAMTFVSGDGRPYVCSRQPRFSALIRFDVSGHIKGDVIELQETSQRPSEGQCDPGQRRLSRYRAEVKGDVLTLLGDGQRQTLYRNRGKPLAPDLIAEAAQKGNGEGTLSSLRSGPRAPTGSPNQTPADVSGVWIWEHRGMAAGGDEKQEREEWHVEQQGNRLTGYYDRVVRQISTDGHAYRCSMGLEFELVTRYQIRGEVRGNEVLILENSYEVLSPNACDNGRRRLDAYEGLANGDEIRLVWGVGGQVLRRPRPDVPTQRF